MKDDEDIETMFSRFQILVSGLQVLNKSYSTADHVKKILRTLPQKFRPKVIAIQEAKDLNTLSLESLMSNLQSHEMELNGDYSSKKLKSLALRSASEKSGEKSRRSSKSSKPDETSEEESDGRSDDDDMACFIRGIQQMSRRNKRFPRSNRRSNFKEKDEDMICYNCNKPGHFRYDCPDLQKDSQKNGSHQKDNFRNKFKKNFMATWEELDDEDSEKEDDANLALMAHSSDKGLLSESEDEDEVYPYSNFISCANNLINYCKDQASHIKILK